MRAWTGWRTEPWSLNRAVWCAEQPAVAGGTPTGTPTAWIGCKCSCTCSQLQDSWRQEHGSPPGSCVLVPIETCTPLIFHAWARAIARAGRTLQGSQSPVWPRIVYVPAGHFCGAPAGHNSRAGERATPREAHAVTYGQWHPSVGGRCDNVRRGHMHKDRERRAGRDPEAQKRMRAAGRRRMLMLCPREVAAAQDKRTLHAVSSFLSWSVCPRSHGALRAVATTAGTQANMPSFA